MLINVLLQPYQTLDIPCLIANAALKQNLYVDPEIPQDIQFSKPGKLYKTDETAWWKFIPVSSSLSQFYYIQNYNGAYLYANKSVEFEKKLRHVTAVVVRDKTHFSDSFMWTLYESPNHHVFNVMDLDDFEVRFAIDYLQIRNKAYGELLYAKFNSLARSFMWYLDMANTRLYTSFDKENESQSLDWALFCGDLSLKTKKWNPGGELFSFATFY